MKAAGARCDQCALRRLSAPVPMESHRSDEAIVVGTAPGIDEVDEGRPLCGPHGQELENAFKQVGVRRSNVALTYAAACRFPDDDPEGVLAKIKRENKRSKLLPGDSGYQITPFEACRPRLLRDLEGFANRIALGGHAAQAMIPERKDAKILGIRGHKFALVEGGREIKVFPTVAPGFVTHARRYAHVFAQDLRNAFSWFRGHESWKDPWFVNGRYGIDGGELLRDSLDVPEFYVPTVEDVRDYLRGTHSAWAARPRWMLYDVETDGKFTDRAKLRCIGVGGPDHVLVVPILSVDGRTRFYSLADEEAIKEAFREFFTDETMLKIGHNAGSFDREMIEAWLGVTPSPLMDTVLLHKGVDAELPHTLDFVGSYYTAVHAWKLDKENGWDTKADGHLWRYNGLDVAVNARCVESLVREAFAKKQITGRIPGISGLSAACSRDPVTRDHAMQALGVGLKRVGIPVRQKLRAAKELEATRELGRWKKTCHALLNACGVPSTALRDSGIRNADAEDLDEDEDADAIEEFQAYDDAADSVGLNIDDFNPGSHAQVRKLIEKVWDLPEPMGLGKTAMRTGARGDGDLRTGKAVLQSYMTDRRLTEQQRTLMHGVFMYRKWAKAFGSEVRPTRLDYDAIRAKRLGSRYKGPKIHRCNLWEDGRVHANWNAHGTLVGRFATSGPNVNNYSSWFKEVMGFEYDVGLDALDDDAMVMVGADVEGIHLRIIAVLWNVPSLQEAFAQGYDVHSLRAEKVLGDKFRKAKGYLGYGKKPEKKTLAAKLRDMIKTMTYAGAYGAEPVTIYRVLRSAVDEKGRLQMPDLKLEDVEVMHELWMRSEPEWERAWARNLKAWKTQGFVATPILGRRRYFLDANENDVKNYEILATEGDIMGEVTQRFVDAVPFEFDGPGTGLILQNHDALYAQVRKRRAAETREVMRDLMNAKYGPIQLRAGQVDIGLHMGEVAV